MELEVFSDLVCPWCQLGKRRLESALADYPHRDEVRVRWRSFQLRPDDATEPTRTIPETMAAWIADPEQIARRLDQLTRLAAEVGLEYRLESARPVNTFDAHRLTHFAADQGVGDAVMDALMSGYTRDNVILTDRSTLLRLAAANGLDPDRTGAMLDSDAYAEQVRADLRRARDLGVTGVPTFVVNGVAAVSGAQSEGTLRALLERARTAEAASTTAEAVPTADRQGR